MLLSEAARGEGAYLLNKRWRALHVQICAQQRRACVARRRLARGVDGNYSKVAASTAACSSILRHLGREKILERLPQIRELALDATGKDAIDTPIPILPGMHYAMGGIETDKFGATRDARRVCRRRSRLRQCPWRQSLGREFTAGNDRLWRTVAPKHAVQTTSSRVGSVRSIGAHAQDPSRSGSTEISKPARAANAIRRRFAKKTNKVDERSTPSSSATKTELTARHRTPCAKSAKQRRQ